MSLQMAVARRAYAGDPGLGSLFKKGLGLLSKTGIPVVSQAAGLVSHALSASRPIGALPSKILATPGVSPFPPMMGGKDPFPGGPGGLPFGPEIPLAAGSGAQPNGRPSGMRLNKTGYFLRDGSFIPPGSKWVKIRRRNALNPRALDRAMGRITSAQRASKKLSRIEIKRSPRRRC